MLTRRISLVRDGTTSEEVQLLRLYDPDEVLTRIDAAGIADVERHDGYGTATAAVRLPGLHVYARQIRPTDVGRRARRRAYSASPANDGLLRISDIACDEVSAS